MPRRDAAPEVAALIERIRDELARIPFDVDSAASVKAAMQTARHVFERQLWPYRDNGRAIKTCRDFWAELLETAMAYSDRARLTQAERDHLCQWQPMPGFDEFYFPELAD